MAGGQRERPAASVSGRPAAGKSCCEQPTGDRLSQPGGAKVHSISMDQEAVSYTASLRNNGLNWSGGAEERAGGRNSLI